MIISGRRCRYAGIHGNFDEWSGEANQNGLPVILVALAAAASEMPLADSVRWPLLVAAVLVASAGRRPRGRITWAETAHLARRVISGRPENLAARRAKDVALAVVIVAAGAWMIVSSFAPTR